jgi:hypothetical protein
MESVSAHVGREGIVWPRTRERDDVRELLEANRFRKVTLAPSS